MTHRYRAAAFVLPLLLSALNAIAAAPDCHGLASHPLTDANIQASSVDGPNFQPPTGKELTDLPAFCRVQMTLTPTADSNIKVEVWLPLDHWNGKLQGIGNGGFAGAISYDGLAGALRLHYATVATDTGHEADGIDATWALNHPEKIDDFGWRAIHLMTSNAKQVIQNFYGTGVKHAYFNSCSDGGREALMEAQRFPQDYDGVIAGAPANYWTHLVSNAVFNTQALQARDASHIPLAKLPAIQAAAQKACDLNDRVQDGVIENPARCHFNTAVLACHGADADSCLLPEQLKSLNKLYAGGTWSGGKSIFPGYPMGGEAGEGNWDLWITGRPPAPSLMYSFGTQFFKNMVYNDPQWDFHAFQADRDVKAADGKMAKSLNSTDPDLRPFARRGGKLILYHGWNDAAIAAPNTIHYYEAVRKKMGAGPAAKTVQLFMVPGMSHCFGGNSAYSFGQFGAGAGDPESDIDSALVAWVEKGIKPEHLIASKPGTDVTHPLCAYPDVARYDGKGDKSKAASYHCAPDAAQ